MDNLFLFLGNLMLFYHWGLFYQVIVDPVAPEFISLAPLRSTREETVDKSILLDQHGVVYLARWILHEVDGYLTAVRVEVEICIVLHLLELIGLGQVALHLLAAPPSATRRAYQRFAVVDNGAVLI